MTISVRQAISAREARTFDTRALRENFLISGAFQPGGITLTYSHLDRTVVGGAVPLDTPLELQSSKPVGADPFLSRREMGVFNIGGPGAVEVDGERYPLEATDCLYIPKGSDQVRFWSTEPSRPAKFYLVSTPAHQAHPIKLITAAEAIRLELGSKAQCNQRVLRQYIHPDVCTSCQLLLGMTLLETGSIWNTMPCHIHDRRSEVYLYFDMDADTRVFHLMGEPQETRHLVVANEEIVLSPGWSIHSGAGTGRYGFVWSMAGDNQDFKDMDFIATGDLR